MIHEWSSKTSKNLALSVSPMFQIFFRTDFFLCIKIRVVALSDVTNGLKGDHFIELLPD